MISNFNCVNPLSPMLFKCVSMTNQECNLRLQIVNVNSDQPVFYLFSIKTSKCNDNCTNIDNPYAKICVPDVVKNLNVKVFNLMARTNETKHIELREIRKCKCRLDAIIFNNEQQWDNDK